MRQDFRRNYNIVYSYYLKINNGANISDLKAARDEDTDTIKNAMQQVQDIGYLFDIISMHALK